MRMTATAAYSKPVSSTTTTTITAPVVHVPLASLSNLQSVCITTLHLVIRRNRASLANLAATVQAMEGCGFGA